MLWHPRCRSSDAVSERACSCRCTIFPSIFPGTLSACAAQTARTSGSPVTSSCRARALPTEPLEPSQSPHTKGNEFVYRRVVRHERRSSPSLQPVPRMAHSGDSSPTLEHMDPNPKQRSPTVSPTTSRTRADAARAGRVGDFDRNQVLHVRPAALPMISKARRAPAQRPLQLRRAREGAHGYGCAMARCREDSRATVRCPGRYHFRRVPIRSDGSRTIWK